MASRTAPEAPAPVRPLGLTTQLALAAGPIMYMLDSSVVNVAIPDMARALGSPLASVQWTASGYLLAMAAGLAASAWLARRFGTLRAYLASVTGFTLASVACALAPTVGLLVAARGIQGLLGAPLLPLALGLLLGRTGASRQVTPTMGIAFFAAPAFGPTVGGLLVSSFGWPSIFLINLPIGLFALVGARDAARAGLGLAGSRDARLDGPGLILLSAGMVLATYGSSQGAEHGWLGRDALPLWLGGLALLAGYAVWARRARSRGRTPAVDLALLADPGRALGVAVCSVASIVLFAVQFLAPVFLQQAQGHSATAVGLALLPQGIAMGLATALGNQVVERAGVRATVVAGMALLAMSTAGLVLVGESTALEVTALLLCGRGIALGLTVTPLFMALLGDLEPEHAADANTLMNGAQRLAGSFGIALLATFYQARAQATGSQVAALHGSALLLCAVAGVGAVAALLVRGGSTARDPNRAPAIG